MGETLAVMFTFTTYGTWLRGDVRGWVDDGLTLPADPVLEAKDRVRMKHPEYRFPKELWYAAGEAMGRSLRERKKLRILALTVQSWHCHVVVAHSSMPIPDIAKCAKDGVTWALRVGRPIWSTDYDKRFCFDFRSVRARVEYVERHNLEEGLPAKPWEFIEDWRRVLGPPGFEL